MNLYCVSSCILGDSLPVTKLVWAHTPISAVKLFYSAVRATGKHGDDIALKSFAYMGSFGRIELNEGEVKPDIYDAYYVTQVSIQLKVSTQLKDQPPTVETVVTDDEVLYCTIVSYYIDALSLEEGEEE